MKDDSPILTVLTLGEDRTSLKWTDTVNDFTFDAYETICFLHFIHSLIHCLVYEIHFQIYRSCTVSVITGQYIITYSKLYVSTDYLDFVIIEFEI
jgi:hypothetical protein